MMLPTCVRDVGATRRRRRIPPRPSPRSRFSRCWRACFERIWYASRRSLSATRGDARRSAPRPSPAAASPTAACRLPRPARGSARSTACCCWWPNTTAPSITSSGSSCASDSTISTAASVPATTRLSCDVFELGLGRVQDVLAVDVADARGADRAVERNAGQRQRRRRADHRGDVGIDLGIDRHHRRDDLHFVVEALGKQRADRTVDQARGQRFLLGRTPFALEEAAGDLAGGVGLFLVVDGQREEILAGLRALGARPR